MINLFKSAFSFIGSKVTLVETAILIAVCIALWFSVHMWRSAIADASAAQARTAQVQSVLQDTQNQLHDMVERQKRTQALLVQRDKTQQQIQKDTQSTLIALKEATKHASQAIKSCLAVRLPNTIIRRLRNATAANKN